MPTLYTVPSNYRCGTVHFGAHALDHVKKSLVEGWSEQIAPQFKSGKASINIIGRDNAVTSPG